MSIIAIWGPPNSGKTTLAVDLAFALAGNGSSVCLISPEPYSELGAMLEQSIRPEHSLTAAQKNAGPPERIAVRVGEGLFLLSVASDADAFAEDLGGDSARNVLERAAEAFDAVLVDCPAATDNAVSAWALQLSESVLILSGCRSASALWFSAYRRVIGTLGAKGIPVCLEAGGSFHYKGLLQMINMTPAVWVPYVPGAEEIQAERKTLYGIGGRSGKAYTSAIDALCELIMEGGNVL